MLKKKKILIVEDNPFNLEIAEVSLEKAGYDIITAGDGEEGLKKLKLKPDLVLLDLSLGKVSGWDVIKKIREDEEKRRQASFLKKEKKWTGTFFNNKNNKIKGKRQTIQSVSNTEALAEGVYKKKIPVPIPVIALTAHAMEGDREKALKMGFSSYISKPCLPRDIVEEVKKFI